MIILVINTPILMGFLYTHNTIILSFTLSVVMMVFLSSISIIHLLPASSSLHRQHYTAVNYVHITCLLYTLCDLVIILTINIWTKNCNYHIIWYSYYCGIVKFERRILDRNLHTSWRYHLRNLLNSVQIFHNLCMLVLEIKTNISYE